jgi:hypothetical protein
MTIYDSMGNIKSTASMHMQNDQTGTGGVSQRNNAAELIMQSGGGITNFTNFNDKTNSLRNNGPVPEAFKKSPYYNSAQSVFGYGGYYRKTDLGGIVSYENESAGSYKKPHSFLARTENSAAIPSDVRIENDIALVSYRNHSQDIYLANADMTDAYVVISMYEVTGHDPVAPTYSLISGLIFPEVGTQARNVTEFDGRRETRTGSSRTPIAAPTNANKRAGYRFTVEDTAFAALAEFSTPDLYNTEDDWISGTKQLSFDGDSDGDLRLIEPRSWDISFPFHKVGVHVSYGSGLFFSYQDNKSATHRTRGYVHNIPNAEAIPSDTLKSLVSADNGAEILGTMEQFDGQSNPRTVYYKIPVSIKSDSFWYKKGAVNRCGRVDIYERRTGHLSAVDGNKITVTGPSGDGTYDTEMLSDGDKIKITSGLKDEVVQGIHPINGIKYVKRTASDTQYLIYDDENLSQPTDTANLRDLSSITWTFYEGTQAANGSWRYKDTLFSTNGLNGNGDVSTTAYVVTGESPKRLAATYTNYEGLEILPEAYRFGQSIDIIKKPGADHYWLAVGEMGKAYSASAGMSYQQECHPRVTTLSAGVRNSKLIPQWGYQFEFPEYEPYGRVWLYKVQLATDAISSINTPEEINASTTNPYVNSPLFLEDADDPNDINDANVDFKEFTDYRNLYWHRAMISNFMTEGRLGKLFSYDDSDVNGGWHRVPNTKSSSGLPLGVVYANRGKPRVTLGENYLDFQYANLSYLGEVKNVSDTFKNNYYVENIFPFYRYNNGPYGDGIRESYLEFWARVSPDRDIVQSSTVDQEWLTDGYKFADGFGHNVCLKLDDVTNGEKPIIAISNTTFPYLSTVSKSTDNQLSELQKKINKLKKFGYEDPYTQDFIDRHTKSNHFIRNFCRDSSDNVASRFEKGSIFIYNPNQTCNTQSIDHTTRLHEDVVSEAYYCLPADADSPFKDTVSFVDWYGKAPSMFFKGNKLFVGTDRGNLNVYKASDTISTINYKESNASEVKLRRKKLLLSRWTLDANDEARLIDNGEVGQTLTEAGYQHFNDYEKINNDEYEFGEEGSSFIRTSKGYKYAIEGWVWKEADLDDEVVSYPYAVSSDSLEDLDLSADVKRSKHRTYAKVTVYPNDTVTPIIYPVNDNSVIDTYSFANQLAGIVDEKDYKNILVRKPFGYSFRYDRTILVAHGTSYSNEFGSISENLAQRLYIYEVNDDGTTSLLQTITPASKNVADNISVNPDTVHQITSFFDGSTSFSETLDGSVTVAYLMSDMYDVVSGKIVLMTPYETAIFADTGLSKNLEFRSQESKSFSQAYFSFSELFTDKSFSLNLNNVYGYSDNLMGVDSPFYLNDGDGGPDRHLGLCAFYNIENTSAEDNSRRNVTGATITVEVNQNATRIGGNNVTVDSERVFPKIAFYKDDPRSTITQKGDTSGGTIVFGSNEAFPGDRTPDQQTLYQNGLQDSAYIIKDIDFVRSNISTDGWVGEVTLTAEELSSLVTTKNLIKGASDSRTIRNNDGTGKTDGTYQFTFDDANNGYASPLGGIESSLIVGLLSHSIVAEKDSDVSTGDLQSTGGWFRWPRVAGSESIPNMYYPPYWKGASEHLFVNICRIKSIEISYKDFDNAELRRFQCRSFENNTETEPATKSFIRLGRSKTPAYFDKDGTVLDGTNSDAIEAITFVGGPSVETGYTVDKRFDSFNMQDPQFLSLAITATPQEVEELNLMLQGQLPTTGAMSLHASGVSPLTNTIPLRLGVSEEFGFFGLAMPDSFEFECDGISLYTPTAYGDPVSSNANLVFPGGSGIEKGMTLHTNRPAVSSSMNLGIGQPVPSTGDMLIAISGASDTYNSIPCIQGNLYMSSTFASTVEETLHLGRDTATAEETLFMGSPDPVSGVLGLNINTAPLNSGLDIYTRGNSPQTLTAPLHIGKQVSEAAATLFMMQPHRLPFEDPRSPAVFEPGDSLQIPTLYVSGAAIPSANSLDNNYEHQKKIIALDSQFDMTPNAEEIITATESNSISRNALDEGSSAYYGVRRISNVGSTLEQYTGVAGNTFYENELSRESIGHNNNLLAIGTNTNDINSESKLQIFDVLDGSSVKLSYTYDKFDEDLTSLGIIDSSQGVQLYFKDVKISSKNKIAVSARVLVASESLHDMIFILEEKTSPETSVTINNLDECALEPGDRISSNVSSEVRWKITSAIKSESWNSSTPRNIYLHRLMGNSLAWKDEDLYYDKQSTTYGSIYRRAESDSYATESKQISNGLIPDVAGYNTNTNNLPEATKIGFGSKITIKDDLAFISSPILDSYIANNTLSGVNAPSPDGAVHIFRYSSSWSYVDSVYSGGYTSANISGKDNCEYDPKLFGYDTAYADGILAVSEPISNTVYQFNISSLGNPEFLDSYTNTDDKYGTFVNTLSRSLITNTSATIEDAVYSESFGFTQQQIDDEVVQYVPDSETIKSASQKVYLVRAVNFSGVDGLIFARDLDVNYGTDSSLNIQKVSFAKLQDLNGTLFIAGPLSSTSAATLMVSPSGGANADMSLHMPVVGRPSGVMTSFLKVAEPASGVPPLHMRGPIARGNPLYLKSEFTDVSANADVVVKGPTGATGSVDIYLEPAAPVSGIPDMFIRGSAVGINENIAVFGLRVGQVDILNASGTQEIIIDGNTNVAYASGASLYMGAGDFGPSSGVTPIRLEGPDKLAVTHTADLAIQTDPASGVQTGELGLFAYNNQSGIRTRFNYAAAAPLRIGSSAFASGILGGDFAAGLVMYRKGISGGDEIFSTGSLYVTNIMDSGNANVYISGANVTTGTSNLVIGSGIGPTTGGFDLVMTGYPSG